MPPHDGNQLQRRKEQKDIEENNKVLKLRWKSDHDYIKNSF